MDPVHVKICGITSVADALAAVAAGADALGFMFYARSSRYVSFAAAAQIIAQVPPSVATVAVLVNPTTEEVHEAVESVGVDAVQFHGEETPEFIARLPLASWLNARRSRGHHPDSAPNGFLGRRTIKAFRVRDADTLKELPRYATDAWLLDSYVAGAQGGTGARFNWDLAVDARKLGRPLILAGGLTPQNVDEGVRQVQPFGVDVSSGVETAPGRKDAGLVRAFINAAKGARNLHPSA